MSKEEEIREGFRMLGYNLIEGKGIIEGFAVNDGSVISSRNSPFQKIRVFETPATFQSSFNGSSSNADPTVHSAEKRLQEDKNYPYIPPLRDELALLILARVPRSEFWKLRLVSKRYLSLMRSGELYKIRKLIGVRDHLIFMLASKESRWWATDRQFMSCRELPVIPSDRCFAQCCRDSFCVGTHLLVFGQETTGPVTWMYEMTMNRWHRGPLMISPRRAFAAARHGNFVFVAGGIARGTVEMVMNSAEKYNCGSNSWELLPSMNKKRQLCSGFYMDNKFYVIGGKNEMGLDLTCGEVYDEYRSTWKPIPNMLLDATPLDNPPLVAVVNNELYWIEASSNQLMVYLKKSNSWKALGKIPVSFDYKKGYFLTFKSLDDELILIGGFHDNSSIHGMPVHTCCPDPSAELLQWRFLGCDSSQKKNSLLYEKTLNKHS